MACYERNPQFLDEVAAALLPIAADMTKEALVVENTPGAPELDLKIATIKKKIADQILREQGINVQSDILLPSALPTATATGGSTAMKYLVQQMLLDWTMTPDQWAADEMAARVAISTAMRTLLTALTAVPTQAQQLLVQQQLQQ